MDDPTSKAIEELAKQLPVKQAYEDAVSPAAKEAGGLAQDLIKCLRFALAPIQYLAARQDRFRTFLDRSIREVPEERRVAPAPQILGPVLEGIRYEPEYTPIDKMFSKLLSSSMDEETARYAHPAFPGIIKQLSSDEAKIIAYLALRQRKITLYAEYDDSRNWFSDEVVEVDSDKLCDQIVYKSDFFTYTDHLHSLSLVEVATEHKQPTYRQDLTGGNVQTGMRRLAVYRLTRFGRMFATACVGALA